MTAPVRSSAAPDGVSAAEKHADEAASPLGSGLRLFITPAVILLLAGGALLYTWLGDGLGYLDNTELRSLNLDNIARRTSEHLQLSAVATIIVLILAIPLGIAVSRRSMRWSTPIVLGIANIGQSAPPIGVLVLLAASIGIGFWPAVIGLVLYAVLPALRNTMVGLQQVDPALIDAARGIGMPGWRVLLKVELPLALPLILAGIRTTLVLLVGMVGLAIFINAGGLGQIVVAGNSTGRDVTLFIGSLLIALLALLIDWIAGVVNRLVQPKGLT
ncbi:osmoprotectant transport system permease protein [Nocardiopsis mwathae]|uniref:Osmoprotectant transport system permease protein n=1 Tax=Nocardiopsis mwathae TaxID=1472723 RepID=A0A7W9YIM8_9ACTN|nr:ABC transporter permease [Nocardiopsis mwathae]MBB6172868.1 osmoprotectant transport system permease protein [Nocardiopsis mwathae]